MMTGYAIVSAALMLMLAGMVVAEAGPAFMPLPLKVVGTRILNSRDEPVTLRGVNCACLEWTSDGQGHIVQSVRTAIDDWHVMQAIQDRNWSWTAWDFHPQAGPTLISDWNYTPTPDFGVFVQQMLAGALPRYAAPTVPATPTGAQGGPVNR